MRISSPFRLLCMPRTYSFYTFFTLHSRPLQKLPAARQSIESTFWHHMYFVLLAIMCRSLRKNHSLPFQTAPLHGYSYSENTPYPAECAYCRIFLWTLHTSTWFPTKIAQMSLTTSLLQLQTSSYSTMSYSLVGAYLVCNIFSCSICSLTQLKYISLMIDILCFGRTIQAFAIRKCPTSSMQDHTPQLWILPQNIVHLLRNPLFQVNQTFKPKFTSLILIRTRCLRMPLSLSELIFVSRVREERLHCT